MEEKNTYYQGTPGTMTTMPISLPEFVVTAKAPKFTKKQKLIALGLGAVILLLYKKL